jgi:cation diffusion facilitator family transporter
MAQDQKRKLLRAITIGLIVNIILAVLKLTFGIWGNAQALISDGLNSFSDVFISTLILIVMKVATKKPDHDHPYGHEKFEGLAYFVLGIIFFMTSIYIGITSVTSIFNYFTVSTQVIKPHIYTVIISIISLIIKFVLFKYFLIISKKYNNPTLKADSKNHLLDAWATLFSVIGLSLAQINLIVFDYIAAFIIGVFIFRLSYQIIKDAISYLVDQAPTPEEIDQIHKVILEVKGVISVDDLKVRRHMTQKYVDVEIGVESSLSLKEAHLIAEKVHQQVEDEFPEVIHCMVHVNPVN